MAASGGGVLRSLATALLCLLLLPLALAAGVLCFALLAALMLSGVGPLLHALCRRSDARLLAAAVAPAPGACVHLATVNGRRLAVRWSPAAYDSSAKQLPPVCIPNGLGATLVTISRLHERLQAMGFPVLSYDRAGVGMSDPRFGPGGHASAEETVADMHAVMEQCAPGARWLLVGPSMGSIVAQCYIATHPSSVAGFLNMDGLPFPFAAERAKFAWAASVYRVYASLVWTGFLRFGLFAAAAKLQPLASAAFSPQLVRAQMNERRFFSSLAAEMMTMMACCDYARTAWGPAFDLVTLDAATLALLCDAAPAACGDADCDPATGTFTWRDLPRAAAERGGGVAPATPDADVRLRVLAPMLTKADAVKGAPMLAAWRRVAVRVMSARSYDFGMGPIGDWFYSRRMRDWAGAEHTLHVMLARGGARTVFPARSHGDMFFGLEPFIAAQVALLAKEMAV